MAPWTQSPDQERLVDVITLAENKKQTRDKRNLWARRLAYRRQTRRHPRQRLHKLRLTQLVGAPCITVPLDDVRFVPCEVPGTEDSWRRSARWLGFPLRMRLYECCVVLCEVPETRCAHGTTTSSELARLGSRFLRQPPPATIHGHWPMRRALLYTILPMQVAPAR